MNKEDQEAANAALLLDQKIEERIWQAIENDPLRFASRVEASIIAGRYASLGREIADIAAIHNKARPHYIPTKYSDHT